jgi:hypothetical protein
MRTVVDVTAKLRCGHTVTEKGLTSAKAERAEETMALSAWCDDHRSFSPTVQLWTQQRHAQ